MRSGSGDVPTVKYVGSGMVIRCARRSEMVSLSSENKSPAIIASEKLFFACRVANFVKTGCN